MNKRFSLSLLILSFLSTVYLAPGPVSADDPVLLNNYGVELMKRREYEKALDNFQKAFRILPNDPSIRKNLATAYAMLGQRLLEKSRPAEAAGAFDQARELFPDDTRYSIFLGMARYQENDFDAARYAFERARSLGGETVEVLYHLGRVYYDTGETAAGVELWEKALSIDPYNRDLLSLLERSRREVAIESRMDRGEGGKFVVSYDAKIGTDLADKFLDLLEDAYNSVGYDLGRYPNARVPVILYTKKDYKSVTSTPDWSGGLYDGKIRLPVGGVTELTPNLRGVVRHEYTHAVVYDITRGNCPTWLNEGLAVLEERKEYAPPLAEVGGAARNNSFLPFKALEGPFTSLGTKEALLAYEQSYLLVDFMVRSYGWHKLQEILLQLGEGMKIGEAIAKALGDFALDYAKVQEEWLAYVRKEYGR